MMTAFRELLAASHSLHCSGEVICPCCSLSQALPSFILCSGVWGLKLSEYAIIHVLSLTYGDGWFGGF